MQPGEYVAHASQVASTVRTWHRQHIQRRVGDETFILRVAVVQNANDARAVQF